MTISNAQCIAPVSLAQYFSALVCLLVSTAHMLYAMTSNQGDRVCQKNNKHHYCQVTVLQCGY